MKNKTKELLAAADGTAVPLSDVPDEVFAAKMLGDGFAVEPENGVFYSPADGVVESVTDTLHAYTIRTDDGLDLLVHIGVDTVELKGRGFESAVRTGDRVRAGDVIAKVDLGYVRSQGYPVITPVVVSNFEEMKSCDIRCGEVIGGKSAVVEYRM